MFNGNEVHQIEQVTKEQDLGLVDLNFDKHIILYNNQEGQ